MNKDKFIVGLVVIILLLLVVGLIWFKVYVSVPHYVTYYNRLQGYSVLIPAWWGSNYNIFEQENGERVDFVFKPMKEEPYLLFAIVKTTQNEWDELKNDPKRAIVSRWLAEIGNDVFYVYWLPNNPYRGRESGKYLSMVRDFTNVFNSFILEEDEISLEKPKSVFCIQVVTTARELITGQIKEFPTPCEVPEGWEIVSSLE